MGWEYPRMMGPPYYGGWCAVEMLVARRVGAISRVSSGKEVKKSWIPGVFAVLGVAPERAWGAPVVRGSPAAEPRLVYWRFTICDKYGMTTRDLIDKELAALPED